MVTADPAPGAGGADGSDLDRVLSPTYAGENPTISVITSTRDRGHLLAGFLGGLAALDFDQHRFELVIVDDGSRDDTWAVLQSLVATSELRVMALHSPVSRGQGPGRNIALNQARGELLAFTDDDCFPEADWLTQISQPFLTGDGVRCGLIVQGRTTAVDDHGEGPWARSIWVQQATWLFETCNIAYAKADVDAAGGFPGPDETISEADGRLIGEDAILGWKVVMAGGHLEFAPAAHVRHIRFPSSYRQYLREAAHRGVFPILVKGRPLARRALWLRVFLAPRSAAAELALAGVIVAAATQIPWFVAAVIPWIWLAWPEARSRYGRNPVVRLAQMALADMLGVGSLVLSSLRHACVVL